MKIEKAIELFVNCDTVTFIVTGCGEESYQTIEFKNVVEALEKQIAKKPLFEDNGGYPEYFEHWLGCPICDEAIPEYTAENNTWCYCLGCGQKLDWSEVENE